MTPLSLAERLEDHENEGITRSDLFHLRNEAAALLRQMAAPGWRTIDSAPRDGRVIGTDGMWVGEMWWREPQGYWAMVGTENLEDAQPTHWMPLPSAPTGETE